MSRPPAIVVTTTDYARLQHLLEVSLARTAEPLEAELARANVVAPEAIPPDLVTMNRDVTYEDLATGARRTVRVVYPPDADAARGWVSVLAPLGSALIGLRVGQEIDWPMPRGVRRIRIVAVLSPPAADAPAP
jgi:regulator of nucleoside diphosphate kinase